MSKFKQRTLRVFSVAIITVIIIGLLLAIVTPTSQAATTSGIKRVQGPLLENVVFNTISQDGYSYRANSSLYQFDIKTHSNYGDGTRFTANGSSIIYQPQDFSYRDIYGSQDYIGSIQDSTAQVNGKTVTYPNVFSGVNLTYTAQTDNIKENFIISQLPRAPANYLTSPVTLDFGGYLKYGSLNIYVNGTLQTGNFVTNQSIAFGTSASNITFSLPQPIAVDAARKSIVLQYEVKVSGSQIWFYVRTPYTWLQTATFPVIIDPTVRVQGPAQGYYSSGGSTSSISVTMASTPTSGNLLIASIGYYLGGTVSSISQTGVTWTKAANETTGVYPSFEIWKGSISSGASKTLTINFATAATDPIADVMEYSGLSGVIDKTATNNGNTQYPSTGTTASTTQANELWFGATFVWSNIASTTQTTPTNSFTLLDGANVYLSIGHGESIAVLEKIVSSTGTASSGTALGGSLAWSGCMVAFQTTSYPTYSGLSALSTLANSSCTFNATFNDAVALQSNGQYQFGTNNTGSWVWDSAVNFTSTPQTVSVTKTLASTVGQVVGYQWNFTNNAGLTNTTGIQTLTTTGYSVTITSSGISTDTSGTIITFNGSAKTQSALPYTGIFPYGYSLTYSFSSTVSATTGKQYVWASTSGLSQTLQTNTFTVSGNGTITGTYTTQYQITSTAGSNGTISPSTAWYNAGSTQTFTSTPNSGYSMNTVTVDGTPVTTSTSCTFTNIQATHNISVTFKVSPLDHLTISGVPSSITAGSTFNSIVVTAYNNASEIITAFTDNIYFTSTDTSATLPYTSGSQYTFTTGDNGQHTFNGFILKTASSQTITVTNGTVSLTSSTITVNPATINRITVSPTVSTITVGNTQTYNATAYDTYNNTIGDITNTATWSINASAGGSWTSNRYTSANNGVWTVTASYSGKTGTSALTVFLSTIPITASAGSGGLITPSGTLNIVPTNDMTFNFYPNPGYNVSSIIVDGNSVAIASSYTFHNVTVPHTITVSFTISTFTITAISDGHSVISPSNITVNYGTTQAVSYGADDGYVITGVIVDGATTPVSSPSGIYTFSYITANHTIVITTALAPIITPTPTPTVTPTGQPNIHNHPLQTLNLYLRSDNYNYSDLTAYGLDADYTNNYVSIPITTSTVNASVTYGFRVYLTASSTIYQELTGGIPQGQFTLTSNFTGQISTSWRCPDFPVVLGSQILRVDVYAKIDNGSWTIQGTFISNPLMTQELMPVNWNFALNIDMLQISGNTTCVLTFGDTDHRSMINNIVIVEPNYTDIQGWQWGNGDIIGLIFGAYLHEMGSVFYAIICLAIFGSLYMRNKNLGPVIFAVAIFGTGGGISCWLFLDPIMAVVLSIIIILASTAIVYKVIR